MDSNSGIHFEVKHRFNYLEVIKFCFWNIFLIGYVAYATYIFINQGKSCGSECEFELCSPYNLLMFIVILIYLKVFYTLIIRRYLNKWIEMNIIEPTSLVLSKTFQTSLSKFLLYSTILMFLFILLIIETRDDFQRLRALFGVVIFLCIGYFFSYNKFAIKWRPVIAGFSLQLLLGILSLRIEYGRKFFKCLSDKVSVFLHYSKDGSTFVFGESEVFAFSALPTIFFFSLIIQILYYWGVMQWIMHYIGSILQLTLGTTVCESINAAGNIFLANTESAMFIRPYISSLTLSELHAVMVSGFSTVAGSVLLAYISFGAEAYHLVTASLMAAPASLFFAKLFYPEIEKSKTTAENIQIEKSNDSSLLDAATNGAKNGIGLFLHIIANLVAMISLVSFIDGGLKFFMLLIGYENVGFEFILGKFFIPISWMLGVEWKECESVGHVIASKTLVNEIVAFKLLGDYKSSGKISARSSIITAFSICSFGNPGSLAVIIGTLNAMAPDRRVAISKVAVRAFVAGSIVSFITAGIAGMLLTDELILQVSNENNFHNGSVEILF